MTMLSVSALVVGMPAGLVEMRAMVTMTTVMTRRTVRMWIFVLWMGSKMGLLWNEAIASRMPILLEGVGVLFVCLFVCASREVITQERRSNKKEDETG